MAERKLKGKDYLLFIDPAGGTSYSQVVCLTSHSFASETNVIEGTTKCGEDSEPGTQSETIEFEGQFLVDPALGKVSAADIYGLKKDQTTVGWKIAKASPVTGDITKAGTGFFSAYNEDAAVGENVTFSGTLTVKGLATQTETA